MKKKIINLVEFQKELKSLSFEDLMAKRTEIETKGAVLKSRLENVKAEMPEKGSWEAGWYRRASHFSKILGRQSQMICAELGIRKEQRRKRHEEEDGTFPRYFMRVAKELLSDTTYKEIMAETVYRVDCEIVEGKAVE